MSVKQKLISPTEASRIARYNKLDQQMQADYAIIQSHTASFWRAAYEMKVDRLWEATGNWADEEAWIGDLSKQEHGPSAAKFNSVMRMMLGCIQNGMALDEVVYAVGSGKTSVLYDAPREFFRRVGRARYELSEAVQATMRAEGKTLRELVNELAIEQSASDGRATVSAITGRRTVFVRDRAWNGKKLLVKATEAGGQDPAIQIDIVITVSKQTPLVTAWLERKFDSISG